ncbi:RHS repeat-associated core domain-containing protein [Luteibacter sp. ME-Dv--P-043b]|uniref:RHS repeat-associated core domain-containing protein n=1 Tax=Luteibacter sp. ME-Dv--P-043b TaxID=3040291 RepID=UPI0025573127|nr:RHS repeat-associated core domain-containing protein [Luteibacter sp. ME-Dv--P-043b]
MSIVRRCLRPGSAWLTALLLLMAMVCASMGVAHAAETITYYYTSPQGTVLAKADASGNIVSNADYRPYGTQVLGTLEQGPGYTGHLNDVDSGLVYMQARYYDPDVGRFLSIDPVAIKPGSLVDVNRFGYANDNPVTFQDPSGRCTGSRNAPDAPCNPSGAQDSVPREPVRPHQDCSAACQRMRDTSDRKGGSAIQPKGFTADGLLVGRPTFSASGMAALGGGIKATKGLYRSDSNVSIVTPAIGLRASADTTLIKLGYDGNSPSDGAVKVGFGADIAAYAILGAGLNIEYTPPYKIEVGIDVGAGAGGGISTYSVGKEFKENN